VSAVTDFLSCSAAFIKRLSWPIAGMLPTCNSIRSSQVVLKNQLSGVITHETIVIAVIAMYSSELCACKAVSSLGCLVRLAPRSFGSLCPSVGF
jgi:hypothetical protein